MNIRTARFRRLWFSTLLLLALLPVGSGCAAQAAGNRDTGYLEGTITVSGAWALYPLMIRWGEEFQNIHPDVRFDISAGGAGKGMADALAGTVDIGMVSREIYPQEMDLGAFWVSVAKDAVFPTINKDNPVRGGLFSKGITRDILIDIYITGEVTTWGQVVGSQDLTAPIHIYTRSDACGAAATFAAYLGVKQENLLGVGVYGDPGLLEAVIRDPFAIGYNNLNYAFDMESGEPLAGAKIIPIDVDGSGQAEASEIFEVKEQAVYAVASGIYPSPPARDLNLVTAGKPSGLVKTFIHWVLSDGQIYVREVGYIELPSYQLQEGLLKLQ
ncbi:MAG: phosphate ABC transporter substrate-binding protein [Anaerolineales bacterium]|nr:phosphate ABC transporter substrate-binding protein [Anaerolineales bacterium]